MLLKSTWALNAMHMLLPEPSAVAKVQNTCNDQRKYYLGQSFRGVAADAWPMSEVLIFRFRYEDNVNTVKQVISISWQ